MKLDKVLYTAHATSAADSTLGMRSPSTDPATFSRSRSHVSLLARLTRTQQGLVAATSATIVRIWTVEV